MLIAIVLVAVFAASGCGGTDGPGDNAHVNDDSGSTNGLLVDERAGTPPPAPAPVPKGKSLYMIARAASCYLQVNVPPKEGRQVPPGSDPPKYKTDPPVSGPYVEPPNQQADGAYLNMPAAIDQLGALNNGRMTIQYAPDLSDKTQLEIKGLYDTMYGATLLFPNDEMEFAVAATAWGNLLACASYDTQETADVIRAFGKQMWGKHGGEPVEAFPFEGPTPADPEETGSPE